MKTSENKVKVELEGPALGTLEWFEKLMSKIKFVIKENEEEKNKEAVENIINEAMTLFVNWWNES